MRKAILFILFVFLSSYVYAGPPTPPFIGGELKKELLLDETGIEAQETDAITDCSSFSATGGGIFYDDSEGKWKKCQDGVLSDLDTTGSGNLGSSLSSSSDDLTTSSDIIQLIGTAEDLDIEFGANSIDITTDTGVTEIDFIGIALKDDGVALITGAANTIDSDQYVDGSIDNEHLADDDFGDFSVSSGVATLDADVVAAAEMADADHGDVSWSGGVATVEEITVSDDEATNDNHEIVFTTDNAALESDGDLHYNPSTGTVTATTFVGALTGNVTGNVTGDVTGDLTGTADLATTVTVSDDESTDDAHEVAFTTDNTNLESDGDFTYNPNSGTVAATLFDGELDGEDLDIANTTAETSIAADDLVIIYDASATANRAMTRGNFVTGIGAGQAITLDIEDDGGNDSTDLGEIATDNDTNNIFTEPSADKLLIDCSKDWPKADLADTVTVSDDESTDDAHEVVFTTDNATMESDGDLNYNPSTGTLVATEFSGGGASLTAVDAATGDSATAFFDAGTIEHERGGLEADVNAYDGLIRINGGSTSNVTDGAGLETALSLGAYASDILACADSDALVTALGLLAGDIPDLSATYEAVDAEILRADTADDISVDMEWQDGYGPVFGDSADWKASYDGTTDLTLEFVTALTAAQVATDPMIRIQVDSGGSGMTADQDVFAIDKSSTRLFDVDEDGDAYFLGTVTAAGFTTTQTADPQEIYVMEGSGGGTDYRGFTVPATLSQSLLFEFPNGEPTANDVFLIGAASSEESALSYGTFSTDNFLVSGGDITIKDGGVAIAEISASGTADNTTYLRGDGAWASGTSTPASGDTSQVQYNNSDSFAAEAAFTYNATNNTLNITQASTNPCVTLGDGTYTITGTPQLYVEGVIETDEEIDADGGIDIPTASALQINNAQIDYDDMAGAAVVSSTGGLNIDEDVDIDFNAADEEVSIVNSAEYSADGAQVTIENIDADVGAAMYLLRLRYTDDGQANADFAVFEDNNGDDQITFTDGGSITANGMVTAGIVTDGTVTLPGDGTITGVSVGGLPDNIVDNGMMADDAIDSAEIADGSIDTAHIADDQVTFTKLDDDGNYGPFTGTWDFTGGTVFGGTLNALSKIVSIGNSEGVHDGDANSATLSDSGESLTVDAYIGMTIYNITDGSSGTITDNDGTTITATLSGGTDDDWDVDDVWMVGPGPKQSGSIFFCAPGATNDIVHPATAGYTACYFAAAAQALEIRPASDAMTLNFSDDGVFTDPGVNNEVDSDGTQGDFIVFVNASATEAYSLGVNGSFSDGAALD